MPRPIITCEKDNGDHRNLGNVLRINLSSSNQGRGRGKVIYQQRKSSIASQRKKISTVSEHTETQRQSNFRKSCCLLIKCSTTNTLAILMWRRPLNSPALVTSTHRRPEGVFDGTKTQVVALMINKCMIKIIQMELYNIRDPSRRGDQKFVRESTVAV